MPHQAELIGLLTANALAFLVYGIDKVLARAGGRRVPEAHLILLGGLSGGVGAWLAVTLFRHKTRKRGFRVWLALATAVGIAGWGWWFLRGGGWR